ncbi:hypothetical protein C0Q58_14305 [Streptomyces albidoflavus]|uniref:hypothetical protein n=1 Tax=Streptomyces albidoflavus TaxID=1886 RepID=UPI00101E7CDD|nr:hypothetical protein [Streptomyces albidoflavus]RZD62912.1 hypothetical protein C0Q58_14305 [Streptomyces albidoflavus]
MPDARFAPLPRYRHLYFQLGCTISSVSGRHKPLGPGIDLRGPGRRRGGYLIGPDAIVAGRPCMARDST